MRHIHLHPIGGAAGDMFVACLLDALPEHRGVAIEAAHALSGVECQLVSHNDGTLAGSRFAVQDPHVHDLHVHGPHAHDAHAHGSHAHDHPSRHDPAADHHHTHGHISWREIRQRIEASSLSRPIQAHAIGIFAVLAEAEGRVHGRTPDKVEFHEVGAVDSIADIVAAAAIIDAIGPATWSVAALPLGGGTIRTAHGVMPVPAPATALLLQGFAVEDDGIPGERVTPTGAAILRYLDCATTAHPAGRLEATGYGFGTRTLPGRSNVLRALVQHGATTAPAKGAGRGHRDLAVISFEVDDQSGEDLAAGLERVRAIVGVHDVVQMPAFGKKSRLAVHVQVLTTPATLDAVVDACLRETTTIGLRTHLVQGRALQRSFATVEVEGRMIDVKLVERPNPDGPPTLTGKAESDHLSQIDSHAARTRLRRDAERLAIQRAGQRAAQPAQPAGHDRQADQHAESTLV